MAKALETEFHYYLDNQDQLVGQYNGRIIVIKGCQVLGVFDSELEAIETTSQEHELGTFLVQRCVPGDVEHTQMYHSRVVFA